MPLLTCQIGIRFHQRYDTGSTTFTQVENVLRTAWASVARRLPKLELTTASECARMDSYKQEELYVQLNIFYAASIKVM